MNAVSIDFETRSTTELGSAGVYRYAADPHTGIWCFAWAWDNDDTVRLWREGEPFPAELEDHIKSGGILRAWNAAFERIIWRDVGVPRYGFPSVKTEQWVCTQAEAAVMGLPRSLEKVAAALRLPVVKDMAGHRVMLRLSRPRQVVNGVPVWWDDPELLAVLYEYCRKDVEVEREVAKRVPRLTDTERAIYLLDQYINDRGVCLDETLIDGAVRIAEQELLMLNERLTEITSGSVTAVTQVGRLKAWIEQQTRIALPSISKSAALPTELPESVQEAIRLRFEGGRSSIAKLDRMKAMICPDGRARGMFQYYGSATGRWAGRGIQLQNLVRSSWTTESIEYIRRGDHAALAASSSVPVLDQIAGAIRGCLIPSPGHMFVCGDFSAIEAVVLNWLAGERRIVAAFRDFFATGQNDPYILMAQSIFKCTYEEAIPKRQIGKITELGCGYQMGWKKFASQNRTTEEEARAAVNAYREAHPHVVQLWYEAEEAAKTAVVSDGPPVYFGPKQNLAFRKVGPFLFLRLPSGRVLAYFGVRLDAGDGKLLCQGNNGEVSQLYGGLLVENIVQATARDLLANAMLQLAPWSVVLHVHDEIVLEVPESEREKAEKSLQTAMSTPPAWADGLPLKVEVWSGTRYE